MTAVAAARQPWAVPGLVRRYHSFVTLVVAGLIAVGLSGLVCDGLGHAYGKNIIAGDSQSAYLSSARCADLFSYHPEAADCSRAELAHHFDEVVTYREVMLPAGVLLAAGYWLARRRWLSGDAEDVATRRVRLSIGVGAFSLAAVLLFGSALWTGTTAGLGRDLSDGLIASIVAMAYGVTAWRQRAAARA